MQKRAVAYYEILNARADIVEAYLDVESSRGWLGGCIIYGRRDKIQQIAYTEADRRATAAGHRLERLVRKNEA